VTVPTFPYETNGPARIANWATYALSATAVALRTERPDVVLASSPHLLTGLAGWVIARRHGVPFVLEVRDMWPRILVDVGRLRAGSPTHRVLRRIERFLYHHADAIVVLAEGVGVAIAEEGVPAERIHLVPNGAAPEDFVPSLPRSELRRRYGFRGFTVVYTGAHGPANGLDLVLDAAGRLAQDLPEVTFVLVGDGLSRPALMARAEREGLTNVVFLQPVPKAEIPDLLAAADVGLHVLADVPLFLYGVSPNKLFDYMAAGLPVLTNTGGEIGHLVKDRDVGIAVGPADLADGVRRMVVAGPDRRARWGANGRAFIRAERDRTVLAQRLEALLDRLCPPPDAGPVPGGPPAG
jgi:glycosyltransferase involved in cell wall biosynthesis